MATYYIDTDNLSTATSIWTDSNLTVKAADGFYQKDGVYRQMSGGELLPSEICPACATPCGGAISASGQQGIYYLNIDLGTDIGAVVVTFNPASVPDGISALFNSVVYNGVSSPYYGWLQGAAGLPTYVGATGNDCGIVANSPYTLDEFQYNGSTFTDLGTTTSVSVVSGQMQLTATGPGNCKMVIPKTAASPSVVDMTFIGPCLGTVFSIGVACPTPLTSFASSTVNVDSATACSDTIDQTYYVAHVNGAAGTLGLYDLVFSDANGEFKLGAGFYKTTAAGTDDWYQVDANGVIIVFGDCVEPPVESYNCIDGNCVDPGDGTGTYATLGECEAACGVTESYDCIDGNCVDPGDGTGTYATLGECEAACGAPTINVASVFGYMEPCSGGAIDDYMGAAVGLDAPADVNTQFVVEVYYVDAGGTCGGTQFTETFNVNILAGSDLSNFDACTQGVNFPAGAVICSACILSCDNPNIIIGAFECPV